MAQRRRITSVIEQQQTLREIARVRFGERKQPNRPGRPLLLPRVTSQSREVIEQVARVYGGEVVPWKPDDKSPDQWEVTVTHPQGLAIAVPPMIEPHSSAYEQWAGGINTVRCDGAAMQYRSRGRWVERACRCAEIQRGFVTIDPETGEPPGEPEGGWERPCKVTTRLTFCILGIEILGLARVDTKSFYAAQEVPATLDALRLSGRAAWLRMEQRSRSVMEWDDKKGADKPITKRFPVIVVEAPFMVDEVMLLDRGPTMAQIPAPEGRLLGRGERPQLQAGATIEPRPPQPGDRDAPPREVPRVDLPPPAPPETGGAPEPPPAPTAPPEQGDAGDVYEPGPGDVTDPDDAGDGSEDPAVEAAWRASAAADQAALPLDDRPGRAPGDA